MRRANKAAIAGLLLAANLAQAQAPCSGTVYLTIDTGSMSQARLIADTLARHQVKATFFLANEKTVNGDHALDPAWAPLWKQLAADGHRFGNHTFDHVYFRGGDLAEGRVRAKPQFGAHAGRSLNWGEAEFCAELDRVRNRFRELTGAELAPIWRAPGGFTTANTLKWARACGYAHVGWSAAGFLGDELPSDRHPNNALLDRAVRMLKDGDVMMMHAGIWSRKEPFAPMLDPLITALKARKLCFGLVGDQGF